MLPLRSREEFRETYAAILEAKKLTLMSPGRERHCLDDDEEWCRDLDRCRKVLDELALHLDLTPEQRD